MRVGRPTFSAEARRLHAAAQQMRSRSAATTSVGAMFSFSPHGSHRPCRKVTAPRSAGSHAPITIVLARRRGFLAEVRSLWRDRSGVEGRVRRGRMMFMAPLKYECFTWRCAAQSQRHQYFREMRSATIRRMGHRLNELFPPDWRTRLLSRENVDGPEPATACAEGVRPKQLVGTGLGPRRAPPNLRSRPERHDTSDRSRIPRSVRHRA